MSCIRRSSLALALCAVVGATPAWGQAGPSAGVAKPGDAVIIIGQSPAEGCFERARSGEATREALEECSYALRLDLSIDDRAATHVNRGIILEARGDREAALADYDDAIELAPNLSEAHANAARVHASMADWAAAAASLDHAIALVEDPLRLRALYFDRAIAREEIGDIAGAYADYQAAAAADPTWEPPRQELQRFRLDGSAGGA